MKEYLLKTIPKSLAESYALSFRELRSNWDIQIEIEDINLYKLGFVQEPQCIFTVKATKRQREELVDQVTLDGPDGYRSLIRSQLEDDVGKVVWDRKRYDDYKDRYNQLETLLWCWTYGTGSL